MQDLLQYNVGNGYCHAWFSRRFMAPVSVGTTCLPHSSLGVDCYVQWTSPIRRLGDLQVHGAVKRYLRRKKLNDILRTGGTVPEGLTSTDVGFDLTVVREFLEEDAGHTKEKDTKETRFPLVLDSDLEMDVDFSEGKSMMRPSRSLQRSSYQYWTLEFVRRAIQEDSSFSFDAVVLGCVDPTRKQYAVYLPEIGLEHRYLSEKGFLNAGERL